MSELKLSWLQTSWTPESWVYLLIGPLAFLLGLFIAYVLHIGRAQTPVSEMRMALRAEEINLPRLYRLIMLYLVLFLAGYMVVLSTGREIPLFSHQPGKARLLFQIFGAGIFLHNVVFIVFFAVLYHIMVRGQFARKFFLVLAVLVSALLYAVTLQRFQIVMAVAMSLLLLYYLTRHLRFRTMLAYCALAIVFFYAVSSLRSGLLYTYYFYITSQMKFPVRYAALTEPYMYFVMNLENFVHSVKNLDQFSYGAYTFDFVTALSGLKHLLSSYFNLNETPFLFSGYNTYTAFWTYYRDFGPLGLFLIPSTLGVMVGWVYYKMRMRPTILMVSMYCLCVFTMIFSFYHNFISFLWYFFNIAGIYVTCRLVSGARRNWLSDGRGI
jgi:oligosaccharide repeat unit polymerase